MCVLLVLHSAFQRRAFDNGLMAHREWRSCHEYTIAVSQALERTLSTFCALCMIHHSRAQTDVSRRTLAIPSRPQTRRRCEHRAAITVTHITPTNHSHITLSLEQRSIILYNTCCGRAHHLIGLFAVCTQSDHILYIPYIIYYKTSESANFAEQRFIYTI